MSYTITPLWLGTITRKKSNMLYQCGSDAPTRFPLIAFLLTGMGRTLLIDTGGSAPDGIHWAPYERPAAQALDAALLAKGVRPEEIEAVFFTHLHWDHAGSNALFPHAQLFAQKSEYDFVLQGEQPGYERALVLPHKYTLLDGDVQDVLPGISVWLTPGHSVGSQTILVDTAEGPTAIVGDLIPTYENIRLGLPNGGNYDVDTITSSMSRVLASGAAILPGHEEALVRE